MTPMRATILVVEDEPEIRRFLRASLGAEGYRVVESATGRRGAIDAGTHKPDLAIVDLGLPDFDGVEVIRRIREWSPMPILVLSARVAGALQDRGARRRRRRLRHQAVRRRRAARARARRAAPRGARRRRREGARVSDASTIDLEKRRATRDGDADVHLTPIEFRLLACLAKHLGMVVTHRQLLPRSGGRRTPSDTHYLRIYMKQLREKLEADPVRPQAPADRNRRRLPAGRRGNLELDPRAELDHAVGRGC